MKFNLIIAFLSFSILGFSQGIEFEHVPWKEALEMAKEEGKPMFVDSYATWCGPCKRMAKDVFTKDEVGKVFNENFINLKLDMEKEDGVTFGHKYPVSAYPTLYFLGGDGNVIHKEKGGKSVDAIINLANMVLRKYDTSGQYAEEYEKGNRDFDLVYKYVKALNKAQKPTLKISNDYLRSNPEITEDQRLMFIIEAAVESDSKLFEEVIANNKKIKKLISEEDYKNKVTTATNATVDKAIEYEVESLLEDAIKAYKDAIGNDDVAILKMQRKYYINTGKKDKYIDLSKDLFKKIKKDEQELEKFFVEIMAFDNDEKFYDLQVESIEKLVELNDSESNIMNYAKLMIKVDDLDKAEKAIDDKLKQLTKEEKSSPNLNRYKEYIKSLKDKKSIN